MATYFFTPFDKRGLGYGYNACCEVVPRSDDWIALMDADTCLFPSNFGDLIEEAVTNHPQYDLYTARATRTHRLSVDQQFPFTDRMTSFVALKKVADTAALNFRGQVKPLTCKSVSGFFLLFRKSLWEELKFPTVGSKGHRNLGIDTAYVQAIRAAGKKIGVLQAPLVVHYYRMDGNGKGHLK